MEELFESAWKEKLNNKNFYFKRVYNPQTKKSRKVQIDPIAEWYTVDPDGDYKFILNEEIRLSRVESGYTFDGMNEYSFLDPVYKHIRDKYWNMDLNNNDPRIMYLDIETRSGINSTGFPVPEKSLEEVSLIQIFDNFTKTMIVFV